MEELIKILHEGNHSLAVKTACGTTMTFDGRGVSDLLRLLSAEPETLRGAVIADKVVGKAAAALMILGGVEAVYADTVSELALDFIEKCSDDNNIHISYNNKVDHIINRSGDGWCPMELACRDTETPAGCLVRIKAKQEELMKKISKNI